MTEDVWRDHDDLSLFAVGTILLRNRWQIARWTLVGGVLAALSAFTKPALYVASASFTPSGTEQSRSALAGLAGQLGVALSSGNQSQSPDFYSSLLTSRVLLTPIARDTVVVQERGGRRIAFLDLFKIDGNPEQRRVEKGVKELQAIVKPSIVRTTGVVEVSVATEWRSVSLAIANELLTGVNDFNQRTRQGQAAEERKFVEGRQALAASDLRAAEDRLQEFLKTNRQFANSPDLTFERDRLERDVTLKQQVYTSLTQSYEEVRIREVRDTPVITVVETPSVPTLPEPRGRLARVLLGLIVGALFGAFLAFVSGAIARRRREGDSEADEFVNTLGEVKGKMLGRFRRMRRRSRV
ncbi:MAG: hypothetical protein M3Z54_08200 [Gemmatimonadota bacterium]|nr:hypothetical protein [Gemmatimonadota bacterium]